MDLPTSFTDLLVELAGGKNKRPELANALGQTYWKVTYWARRNDIPDKYWPDLIRLSEEKGLEGVTKPYLRQLRQRSAHDRQI